MGQYHVIVNLDRREYLNAHAFGSGWKAWEQINGSGTPQALFVLLTCSNGRGGGDLFAAEPEGERIYGRWAGQRIAVVGDYAEDDDLPEPQWTRASTIWSACMSGEYRDISHLVQAIVAAEVVFP